MSERSIAEIIGFTPIMEARTRKPTVDDLLSWLHERCSVEIVWRKSLGEPLWVQIWGLGRGCDETYTEPTVLASLEAAVRYVHEMEKAREDLPQ